MLKEGKFCKPILLFEKKKLKSHLQFKVLIGHKLISCFSVSGLQKVLSPPTSSQQKHKPPVVVFEFCELLYITNDLSISVHTNSVTLSLSTTLIIGCMVNFARFLCHVCVDLFKVPPTTIICSIY